MTPKIQALTKAGSAIAVAASLLVAGQAFAADTTLTKNQEEGKSIAFNKSEGNCLACHKMADGAQPGNIGPALIAMKIRYPNKQELFDVVWDPRKKFGSGVIMPPFGDHKILTKEQIEKVVDYLYTL
ncbi:MAG: sulfur oxidation c-type cytochrome SoxX [Halothiobacillus sp. 15-55-196]|jgi:sulfur-oxidizing protein SoxX|uniref:sulfur oxidation c-type cytochrome SoxX n=1 Tax=Halothiobacillus sp. 15-55-196 TaxID=1970382 RepID=UPI000BD3B095|nr:sulfur oxidation c-type cytochrome SoxX [Halothiobacillus sp. 15-55-196]OZB37177.1 MAG: sulfur oxidation c-type cytochrome SoxX [Halothiobacillus sp. 15-55-196]OZB78798.1 MAG: sulfur oxidation c-type cytochrome SoxX [Halothiobacillus sp. 13-55-115]